MTKKWMLIVFSLLAFNQAAAETRYVMDVIYIGVRATIDPGSQQIAVIKSGEKLEVLDTLDEHVQVRTEKGEVGWVKERYLTTEPIAAHLLENANKRIESLRGTNDRLNGELASVKTQLRQIQKENKTLSKDLGKVSSENKRINEIAKKPLELSRQTQELSDQVTTLQDQVVALTAENTDLKESSGRDWFLAGAAVVILGILLGLIVPRMRFRRRSEWA